MYSAGLESTWEALKLIAFVLFVFGVLGCIPVVRKLFRLKLLRLTAIALFLVPLALTLGLFPAVYSTLNLLHQNIFDVSFWKLELSSGVFALRVSSYILTFHMIIAVVRLFKRKQQLGKLRASRGLNEDEIANYTVDRRPADTRMWIHADVATIAAMQFLFYLVCLGALWYCTIHSNDSIIVSLSSWALFFIIDDWVVIADYSDHYSEPALNSHTLKILAFDFVLLVFVPLSALYTSIDAITVGLSLTMLLTATGVAMFTWRARHLHIKK